MSPCMMFSQGHVSVRKLVQSYDVDMLTCGTCLVRFGSLLVRLVHLVPLFHVDSSSVGYGKPNGAKFKKQNRPHVQQICYQGQE